MILVVGTGYVGLVTGACLAKMGHKVICLDIDEDKIKNLNCGKVTIFEPGLEEIVKKTQGKNLFFTNNYAEAVKNSEVCFLALPTPSQKNGSCDLSYLFSAVSEITKYMSNYILFVNKSTVPVGTGDRVKKLIIKKLKERKTKIDFDVISNPEFLKEGNAIEDCMNPDRIVIGSDSERGFNLLKQIYAPLQLEEGKIIEMDILSAEMTKYAANAMLATRISFMNELAQICKRKGANINNVRLGIGSDNRIGKSFLFPGIGYGGSCFPKDIRALIHMAKNCGYTPKLIQAVETINLAQKQELIHNLNRYFAKKGGLNGKTIAIWGLSFKPNTDDMREAPSLTLIQELQKLGVNLRLFDPIAMKNAKQVISDHTNLTWCSNELEATNNADAIALLTEWNHFKIMDFKPIIKKMKNAAFFDGRNLYKAHEMKAHGFDYIGIGVPEIVKD